MGAMKDGMTGEWGQGNKLMTIPLSPFPCQIFLFAMKALLPCLCLSLAVAEAAEPRFSDVFSSGKEGYKSIRIPSVVVTKHGVVLAWSVAAARPSANASTI